MEPIIVLCTCKERDVKKLVDGLLTKKLVACVNIFPVKSFFWWKGKVESEKEVLLIMKSFSGRWNAIQKEIKETHSYEVPEIISIPVKSCSPNYLQWMEDIIQ